MILNRHNPDVLMCLANLSNDEVFTPPKLANQMLDTLPEELWSNPDAKFLDPFCKSGVFLREITKRLIKGLEHFEPDLQKRVNHIMEHQVYGIGITELTALMTRRSLYCTKNADGKHSVTNVFDIPEGNVAYDRIEHTFQNGKCTYCGASQEVYDRGDDLETHAYQFIHNNNPFENMQFDVIIGNPPYQLSVGNNTGNASKAKAIYHHFIIQSMKLNPNFICMITPSRWMTKSTEGIPDEWVDEMISSDKIMEVHDFPDSKDCFPGVSIEGGVSYFKWKNDYNGKCKYYHYIDNSNQVFERFDFLDRLKSGILIRDPRSFKVIEKVSELEGEYYNNGKNNFSTLVSSKDFFTNKEMLTSSWKKYSLIKNNDFNIKYYVNKNIHKIEYAWVAKGQIPKNIGTKDLHKVYIPAANGSSTVILGKPFYGEPNSVCSQTYLVIGYDPLGHKLTELECENIISYIKTRFFRYLVSIKKKTQNGPRGVYQFVPLQDFSEPWTDEKLYKKYNLTQEEIDFIESMIRPME